MLETTNETLLEVEKTILAVSINSPNASYEITSKLQPADFSTYKHQKIFESIINLSSNTSAISITNVADYLQDNNLLDKVGGLVYLTEINNYYITDEGIEEYILIVYKNSVGRKLDQSLQQIKKMREENSSNIDEVFSKAQELILSIESNIKTDDAEPVKKTILNVIKKIELLEKNGNVINGVTSGLHELDRITNGWQNSDFIILAARPSMGKTAFALNLAFNAAQNYHNVSFISLEMPKEQLVQRMLGSVASLDVNLLRNAQGLEKKDWNKITIATEKISKMNIIIDDTPGLNILELQSKLRKQKRDFGIDICFIDYLQLISGINKNGDNRQNEVATISRQLKKIARELNIPIICLSQLSRSVEKREEKVPLMSDLRDSGAIEQDADIIMFLYRENYYKTNSSEDETSDIDETDIIISKHRNGSTGSIKTLFFKKYGKFTNKNN